MINLLKKNQLQPSSTLAHFQGIILAPQATQLLKGGDDDIIIHDVVDG